MRAHIQFKSIFSVLLVAILTACASSANHLPGGVILEEHALGQAPVSDPFNFQPVEGTKANILLKHADERSQVTPTTYSFIDGNPVIKKPWGGSELNAVVFTDAGDITEQFVQVSTHDDTIFTTSAGMPSPVMPLQGLWTYGRHWALEILYATPATWTGRIFIDGIMVNQDKGYDEAFGFQLLSDQPFFFYKRNGLIGISYDGREADLDYNEIPHYLCCSDSILNPIPAENMVAFFARRSETWYYVELGTFK